MRDSKSSEKKPIKQAQAPRPPKHKLERIGRKSTTQETTLEQVIRTKELFEKTFLSLDSAAFILDGKIPPTIIDCNPAVTEIFGYTRKEIMGKTTEFLHINQKALEEFQSVLFPAIENQGLLSFFEYRMKRKSGDIFPTEHSVLPLKDREKNRIGWISIVKDITERKQMEEKLQQSKEKMRSLLELSPDFITIVDPDHTIQFMNRVASGYRAEEVIGKSAYSFIEPRYHDDARKALSQTFATGQSCSLVVRGIDHNAQSGWFENRLAPIRQDGAVVAVMVVGTDITKRRKAEEKLKQSREFLANTINALEDTFFVKDQEHRWTVLNDAACEAIGRPREELIGKSDYDLFPKEQADEFWEKDNLVLETGETNVSEEEVTWRGKLHTISTKKSLFKDFITGKRFIVGTARDITERKQMERTLRESEQKYRALVEQSLHGIVILQDYRIVFANAAAMEIAGLTIVEAQSLSLEDMMSFIPPENRATARERLKNRFAGRNVPQNYELRLIRKNGEEFWLNLFFSSIEYQGRPAIQLAFTVITERKRAEEALRRSEKRFREFFENTAVGVYRTTPDGRILIANPALVHMLGYSSFEELSQRNLEEEGFEPQYSRSMFKEEIEHKGRIVSWESIWTTLDGKRLYVIENARAVQDEDGRILYYEGTAENITERKKAEEALRESEQRYRAIFEQAADSIVLVDVETGEIVEFNDRTHKNLGYTREEFQNLKIPDFEAIESEEKVRKHLEKIIRTGADTFETKQRTKDGEIRDIHIRSRAISIRDKDFVQSIWRDITDRKKAEEKLREYQEQLKSLASELTLAEERERRRIATELHDEISQSLFISKMKLEALQKSASDKKYDDVLDEINNSLGRIIASMRSLTFDLSSPILYEFGFEEAVAEWLTEQVGKKYGIETEFEDDELPKPLDDDIQVILFRNVRELLINVVKHARAKKIKVSIRKVGHRIRVSIEDNGVGFDPKKEEAMITNKKAFGLFSIRERLAHLGGNLQIKSSPGCGCRITITSPLNRENISKDK